VWQLTATIMLPIIVLAFHWSAITALQSTSDRDTACVYLTDSAAAAAVFVCSAPLVLQLTVRCSRCRSPVTYQRNTP
jgi:hypothetical protein